MAQNRETGNIKFLNKEKGFGFIKTKDRDIWFHFSQVEYQKRSELEEGMLVEFKRVLRPKGLNAEEIMLLKTTEFLNPYNFVRSIPKNSDTHKIKFFSKMGPVSHGLYEGVTGYLKCKIVAETPLFISSGTPYYEPSNPKHPIYNFLTLNGDEIIPGSALRGMLRSNYETITNSCYSIFDDKKYSRRMTTTDNKKGEIYPAQVIADEDGYKVILYKGRKVKKENERDYQFLQPAAWIKMYEPIKKDKSTIESKEEVKKRGYIDTVNFINGSTAWAVLKPMSRTKVSKNDKRSSLSWWNVQEKLFDTEENALSYSRQQKDYNLIVEKGIVCITGQNMDNKHDEKFFFGEKSEHRLMESVIKEYESILKDYKERHAEDIKDEIRKEVLIINNKKYPALSHYFWRNEKMTSGDLVYARVNGDKITEIVPVQLSRKLYENSTGELLDKDLHRCTEYKKLCPACRLFGWTKDNAENGDERITTSYASRLQVSNAKCTQKILVEGSKTLGELSNPKPTTTFFYLKPKEEKDSAVFISKESGYKSGNQEIRGRKYYYHHTDFMWRESLKTIRNRTINGVMDRKSEFEFDIYFNNLSEEELGGLIWSIELEEGMYNRIGYGKPLGLGSIKINVLECKKYNFNTRYSSLDASGEITINIQEVIKKFKKLFEDFDEVVSIKDLKILLSNNHVNVPIHYPMVNGKNDENFKWFQKANANKNPLPYTHENKALPIYEDR